MSLEGLTQLSNDGRPQPKLAERWAWEGDGLRLRVYLRRGVFFHDGTPLDSDSAVRSLTAAIARPGNRAQFSSLNDITRVHADGPLQVVFDLSRPSALLPEDLELPLDNGQPGVGTGPYRISKQGPSEYLLEAFDRYYQGQAQITRVSIRTFEGLRTAWSSLLRGELDMVTDVPPDVVSLIENPQVQVISFPRSYQYLVAFNSIRGPLASPELRRALNMAIDRAALVKTVFQGRAMASSGPIWPQHWAYDNSVPPYNYDPGQVSSLLKDAGYAADNSKESRGKRLHFTCLLPANFSVVERLALEVQRQLFNVGIDMLPVVVSPQELDSRIRAGNFEALLLDLISGPTIGQPYLFWASPTEARGLNLFGYDNGDAERQFDVLRSSTNEAAVRSAVGRLQRVFQGDPPALFLVWNERSRAVRRNLGVVYDPLTDAPDPIRSIWRWTPGAPPPTP